MRAERRDELGPLAAEIAERLTPCSGRGQRAAMLATLELATAVLLVVPDIPQAIRRRTSTWVLRGARAKHLPYRICDPATAMEDMASWVAKLAEGDRRIMVTGPRATRWNAGEGVARRLVKTLALI